MAQYVPHYEDWQTVAKWRKASSIAFYSGIVLSLLIALKEYAFFDAIKAAHPLLTHNLTILLNYLTFLSLIIYPVIDVYIGYYLSPGAEEKRRDDFLDNAFGTQFLSKNSEGYYTNETLNPGFYKAAVNLFENSFFTYRITAAMTTKKVIPLVLVLVVIILLAIPGWSEQPLALPMLQLLFSSVITIDFIKFWLLRNKAKQIYEGWHTLFRVSAISQHVASQTPEILRYWLLYESTLAQLQVELDSAIFNQLNGELSQEWEIIKRNLHIENNP